MLDKVKSVKDNPIFLGKSSDEILQSNKETTLGRTFMGINFRDTWNIALAATGCIALLLLIIMIIAAAVVYYPNHHKPALVFDKTTSLRYLYYAYAAYNAPTAGQWNCPYCIGGTQGFDLAFTCQYNDTYVYVGFNPSHQEVVASFRGSSNEAEWIVKNLSTITTPPTYSFPGVSLAYVYQPFFQRYQGVQSCVTHAVQQLLQSSYPVSVVGHGLGGALASFAALDFKINAKISNVKLWTFGSPRIGNKAYATAVWNNIGFNSQKMVHYDDCVPHLPFQEYGYWREPVEIFDTTGNGDFRVCDNTGEDPTCSDSVAESCMDNFNYMGVQCCSQP